MVLACAYSAQKFNATFWVGGHRTRLCAISDDCDGRPRRTTSAPRPTVIDSPKPGGGGDLHFKIHCGLRCHGGATPIELLSSSRGVLGPSICRLLLAIRRASLTLPARLIGSHRRTFLSPAAPICTTIIISAVERHSPARTRATATVQLDEFLVFTRIGKLSDEDACARGGLGGWVELGRSPRLDAKVPVPTKHAMRALETRRSRNMIVYYVANAEVRIRYRKAVDERV